MNGAICCWNMANVQNPSHVWRIKLGLRQFSSSVIAKVAGQMAQNIELPSRRRVLECGNGPVLGCGGRSAAASRAHYSLLTLQRRERISPG